ncbi:MAG: DUF5706 domain-containing protein [Candidatus Gracilibacteria bacterium]|nr:DUF5706 domain-containing protein [Candidatus Gracilibacteria bacterium]
MASTQQKFEGIFRGSILGTTINKHVAYIGLADKRAQGIITINAILIPLSLNGLNNPMFKAGAIIVVLTAILSIATAIFSLYPRSYQHTHESKTPDLLHFRKIASMSEAKYMEEMKKMTKTPNKLTELMIQDLYHISRIIVTPKYDMLKKSYFIFLVGNSLALLLILGAEIGVF